MIRTLGQPILRKSQQDFKKFARTLPDRKNSESLNCKYYNTQKTFVRIEIDALKIENYMV